MKPFANKLKMSRVQIAGLIVGGLFLAAFTALGIFWALSLRDPVQLNTFQELVESLGAGGWLVLLAIQYIQIVVAFIPGGPIQVVAGALYGPLAGGIVCLLGTVLGTCTVYALVHRFGRNAMALFVEERDIQKYKFLHDSRKLEMLVLILFFIPGTPKDALTYLFALTPLPLRRFVLLSTIARTPAMLSSVFAGDSVMQGQWLRAGILLAIVSVIGLLGILLRRKFKPLLAARKADSIHKNSHPPKQK